MAKRVQISVPPEPDPEEPLPPALAPDRKYPLPNPPLDPRKKRLTYVRPSEMEFKTWTYIRVESQELIEMNIVEGDILLAHRRPAIDGDLVILSTPDTRTPGGRIRRRIQEDGHTADCMEYGFIFRDNGQIRVKTDEDDNIYDESEVFIFGVVVRVIRDHPRFPIEMATVDDFPKVIKYIKETK